MNSRYNKSQEIINATTAYSEILRQKKLESIKQYATYDFKNLKELNSLNLDVIYHTFQPFDKLFMISQKYYESPEYGWLILYTNKLGSELNIKTGTLLKIYFPLESLLELL